MALRSAVRLALALSSTPRLVLSPGRLTTERPAPTMMLSMRLSKTVRSRRKRWSNSACSQPSRSRDSFPAANRDCPENRRSSRTTRSGSDFDCGAVAGVQPAADVRPQIGGSQSIGIGIVEAVVEVATKPAVRNSCSLNPKLWCKPTPVLRIELLAK